ncbi:HigA family addiction module antitoxin [Tahibacter soli]|jgi:addiction module HigA family antidote|uniref:HigA family addiction module antitoxin n=1 Tax=Tahibacter soli TaxID=2983605 RepID=A0A9X3YH96_9GAMM|nr:HigA family addiction module antitoxin [Tahibacter soli]MDC8011015.1 HigA family addiction module antitoxin [Tahibacter soli]
MSRMHNPPHPGEILAEWLSETTLVDAAERLGVTRPALSRVVNGRASVSAEMDIRLSKALGTTPGFWLSMQAQYDIWHAEREFKEHVEPIYKIA